MLVRIRLTRSAWHDSCHGMACSCRIVPGMLNRCDKVWLYCQVVVSVIAKLEHLRHHQDPRNSAICTLWHRRLDNQLLQAKMPTQSLQHRLHRGYIGGSAQPGRCRAKECLPTGPSKQQVPLLKIHLGTWKRIFHVRWLVSHGHYSPHVRYARISAAAGHVPRSEVVTALIPNGRSLTCQLSPTTVRISDNPLRNPLLRVTCLLQRVHASCCCCLPASACVRANLYEVYHNHTALYQSASTHHLPAAQRSQIQVF